MSFFLVLALLSLSLSLSLSVCVRARAQEVKFTMGEGYAMSLSGLCIIEIQGASTKHGSVVRAVEFLALVLWLSLATPLDRHFSRGGSSGHC